MYSPPPDPSTAQRMRAHHDRAARALGVTYDGHTEFWGWAGRTLGRAGTLNGDRPVWLRLVAAPEDKAAGKLWEGSAAAQTAFGSLAGHRPTLLAVEETVGEGIVYRAELSEHLDMPVLSADPILRAPADFGPGWWEDLRTVLGTVASTATDRIAVRQEYIDRALPEFLGVSAPENICWTTAHGDLHWANLTGPSLRILDWEGWGCGPYGYDQATLYAYSLLQPGTADRVRECFPELGTPTAWAGEAVVVAELLQTVSRGHNRDLAGPLRSWAERLRAQSVPEAARPAGMPQS
ncbi:hypothetical protein [Streptomyces mobaraensis]|uniref:Phosphotransferase n=1 Tax=Streptomyces mobaraensis TaxID=35621 RepID=A0A5N5VXC5_STRMB|nr:hypothetical protein [Streptomyces mobaraensis]KAB7833523.1 hypothetical protein FRZ00_33280 [Streptomyces mobaraensis]